MACLKESIFEFTNTMVMIITADDESNKAVTINPTTTLLNVLEVNLSIQLLAFAPIAAWMVSDKLLTAKRKRTNPASIANIISVIHFIESRNISLGIGQQIIVTLTLHYFIG
jgi:branched-subunit amino acid transport protein